MLLKSILYIDRYLGPNTLRKSVQWILTTYWCLVGNEGMIHNH